MLFFKVGFLLPTSRSAANTKVVRKNAKIIALSYVTRLLPDHLGRTLVFNSRRYWKHCLGTSIAAYMIATKTNLCNRDKMFTLGLIHDIGIAILNICLPVYPDRIHEMKLMHLADSISTNYYEQLLGNKSTFIYTERIMDALNVNKDFIAAIAKTLPSKIEKLNARLRIY